MPNHLFPVSLDLENALQSIVAINTYIPANSYSADLLGTERSGHGIIISEDGLILTVGYILTEAQSVWITMPGLETVPAYVIANDHESGLGLVRTQVPVTAHCVKTGLLDELRVGDTLLIAGHGDPGGSMETRVTDISEFAGRWEYILNRAIYTSPIHPNWAGAALLGKNARLYGIGCLLIQDAEHSDLVDGYNMFIPVDTILLHIDKLIETGGRSGRSRPWLGMLVHLEEEGLVVTGVFTGCPADKAGLKPGDVIVAVADRLVTQLSEFFRAVWSLGDAGVAVPLRYTRDSTSMEVIVISADRESSFIHGPLN